MSVPYLCLFTPPALDRPGLGRSDSLDPERALDYGIPAPNCAKEVTLTGHVPHENDHFNFTGGVISLLGAPEACQVTAISPLGQLKRGRTTISDSCVASWSLNGVTFGPFRQFSGLKKGFSGWLTVQGQRVGASRSGAFHGGPRGRKSHRLGPPLTPERGGGSRREKGGLNSLAPKGHAIHC